MGKTRPLTYPHENVFYHKSGINRDNKGLWPSMLSKFDTYISISMGITGGPIYHPPS